jgi:hypothetical protein
VGLAGRARSSHACRVAGILHSRDGETGTRPLHRPRRRCRRLDLAQWWTPTAKGYFGRVPKAQIAEAVTEGVDAQAAAAIGSLKKTEMAERAEALLAGTGWLPALLRA